MNLHLSRVLNKRAFCALCGRWWVLMVARGILHLLSRTAEHFRVCFLKRIAVPRKRVRLRPPQVHTGILSRDSRRVLPPKKLFLVCEDALIRTDRIVRGR